ncbi:MAG: hypothetical protein V4719_13225 [Planctomycetota bacterium]
MRFLRCLLATCTILGTGCGSGTSDHPTGHVTGTVQFNGQPLPAGIVLFENEAEGIGASAAIKDGKFSFQTQVRTGEYRVAVRPPPPPAPHETPLPPGSAVKLPRQYLQSATSKLTASVETGTNSFEFDLLPGK